MKNFDLESKIKSVRVPERDEAFWQTLPQLVVRKAVIRPIRNPLCSLFTILNSKFAFAALVLGLCLWQSRMPQTVSRALVKDEQELRQSLAQFPKRLETLMRDEHGLHKLVQDPP